MKNLLCLVIPRLAAVLEVKKSQTHHPFSALLNHPKVSHKVAAGR